MATKEKVYTYYADVPVETSAHIGVEARSLLEARRKIMAGEFELIDVAGTDVVDPDAAQREITFRPEEEISFMDVALDDRGKEFPIEELPQE